MVQNEASSFGNIQHFTDQGIDFSHHFKFEFTEIGDLLSIIRRHDLTPTRVEPTRMGHLPSWYDPYGVPPDAPKFGHGGSEPVLLTVDPTAKIAYCELVHL